MVSLAGHTDLTSIDLTEALSQLRADRDAIPWPARRHMVGQIIAPLTEGMAGDPFRGLFLVLAEDPKWEVRKEVADALATIPDNDLAVLAERFLVDPHAYVRRAAKQSIERRRKSARDARKKKRGVELVLALYEELEDQHGKAAADKARRLAEQLYDTLIGATVHEMRSVLTALKEDNAKIIERDMAGELEATFLRRKSLKIADRLEFMERLVQDMRNYAQPVSGDRTVVSIADLLTEVRSIVSENLKARNINPRKVVLNVSVPADLTVNVSRVHMVTAIVNILKNAYEFLPTDSMGPCGQVDVQATAKPKHVHITIHDTGLGIPAANLDEVRQCLPGRTSRRNIGTGFGLCNARRFVEAHGGRLMIDSRENDGTTVTMVLPIA